MGKLFFLLVVLILGGIGYYLWTTVASAPKEATLPGYTNALKNDEDKARAVMAGANTESVQGAVEKYKGDKGTLPASLQDLVPNYIDHIPGGLQYDPGTGKVSVAQ